MPCKIKSNIIILMLSLFFLCATVQIPIQGSTNENTSTELTFIPIEIAVKIVENKINQLGKQNIYFNEEKINFIYNDENDLLCYFFNLNPSGYIVISAYYELPAVIAYSFTNKYSGDSGFEAQFLSILKNDLNLRIQHINYLPEQVLQERRNDIIGLLENGSKDSLFEQWPPEGTTPTDGWVETTWHQNAPFNNYCPIDSGGGQKGLAGCPAVAMAQILNYHQTINSVFFSDDDDYYHNYGGNQFWIDDDYIAYDFPSFPQLNNYLNTLSHHYDNELPLTDDDKAAITFACGVAAEQVYNPSGSGTFGVDQAYDAYLKFNVDTVELLDENDPDVYTRLADDIKNANPAHLAIVNEEWTSGHNLVVDGYNTDEYFHLNFGWSGSYDGWYLLPSELPFELTVIEGIIVNIVLEPENNETIDINQPLFNRGFPIRHTWDGDWGAAQNFTPTLENVTGAEIYLRKFGTPEFNLIVELRSNHPQGSLLDSLMFTPEEIASSWQWLPLDFVNLTVEPDTNLFIVLPPAPSNITTSFGYEWGYAFGNQYDGGSFWFTRDGGGLWRDLPTMYEFTFKTYG
jgi:peptidase C10-like protein